MTHLKNYKRILFSLSLVLLTVFGAERAEAFIVASFAPNIDSNAETRVIVIGRGKDMGRQFAQAAMGKALRLREYDPSRNVVVISIREDGTARDRTFFERFGVTFHRFDTALLSGKVLVQELKKIGPMASLEFFSHSGWAVGPGLEGGDYRFNLETEGLTQLAGRFTRDAFMIVHGCNSGYQMAPGFSKLWGIPVAGSLGATDFQQYFQDGIWYHHNPGQFPSNGQWASRNSTSYESPLNCSEPGSPCYRMKSDNTPYQGIYGKFQTGLGFYKFFCANGEDAACLRGVRKAVLSSVSVVPGRESASITEYRALAKDWLCGNSDSGSRRKSCEDGIDSASASGNRTFTGFRGNSLNCSLTGCTWDYNCSRSSNWFTIMEVCGMVNTSRAPSTAFMDDYALMMRAFNAR